MRIARHDIGPFELALLAVGTIARIAGYPVVSLDERVWVIPWYHQLCQGGFHMLATDFSNYSPPYLYLLWLASHVFGPAHPLLAIKCLNALFDVGLCAAGVGLVRSIGAIRVHSQPVPALRIFAIFWCLPTVIVNSAVWGQCDALYGAFVLASLAAVLRVRPYLALALFGIALSIKLQAIFIAPAIGALLLARRLPWRALPVGAVALLAMWLPAALAGRSWGALLAIYAQQTGAFHQLALDAPNLWSVADRRQWIPGADNEAAFEAGLAASLGVGIAYLLLATRRLLTSARSTLSDRSTLLLAFLAAFLFPFVLPRMHDRYFYLADLLSLTLALCVPRWWRIAALVQVGSLTAYGPFLLGGPPRLVYIGAAANCVVCVLLMRRWWLDRQQPADAPIAIAAP